MIPGRLSRHGVNGPGVCRYYRTDTVFISSVAGQFILGDRTIHPGRSDNSSGTIGQSDLRAIGAAGNRSFIACRAARDRSFNRILAHSTVFSLIFARRFSTFLTKNVLYVFLCYFMLIFQPAAGMHEINYGRFSHFEPLFSASGLLSRTSKEVLGASKVLQRDLKSLAGVDSCG